MRRVVVVDAIDPQGLEILRAADLEVQVLNAEERADWRLHAARAGALVVRSVTRVGAATLAALPRLEVIGCAGAGTDNVDVEAAAARGVRVVHAPEANAVAAAEHTFALLLGLARHVAAADAAIKAQRWEREPFLGFELAGKTLGIVGCGRIGSRVARRAAPFEMRVLAADPYVPPNTLRSRGAEPVAYDELLRQADVVTFHVPLTGETRHMFDERAVAKLRPGALLVNCARGAVVDGGAVLRALEIGRLAGAALDVFEEEPPADWSLARHPRVLATPHLGGRTREAQRRVAIELAGAIVDALGARPDENR
jgi:D-3-phosphoglycerate dehydrogenase / 2-oxoglutarate reductase